MRLTRGKRLLRRLLATDLRREALAYGLYDAGADGWRETRVWCPECGQRRLLARLPPPPGVVSFRCPACNPDPRVNAADFPLADAFFARLIGGLARPRLVLRRTHTWSHGYFRRALRDGSAPCANCGRPLRLHMSMPETASPGVRGRRGVHVRCETCGAGCSSSLSGLVISLPEVQRFWREHSRIRALPEREVEADGRVAIVSSFQGIATNARLDVVSARDTFDVLGIHAGAAADGD
jgi:DNA-directed RNA polymerase subunit RPC12/RpoP